MGNWQVHTLPNILGRPVYSLYPQYGAINVRHHLHRLMKPECGTDSGPAYVMWTHTQGKSLCEKAWVPFRPFIEYKSCRRRAKSYQHHTRACCHTIEHHRPRTCYYSWRSSPISRSSNQQQGQRTTQGTWTISHIHRHTWEGNCGTEKNVVRRRNGKSILQVTLPSVLQSAELENRTKMRPQMKMTNGLA